MDKTKKVIDLIIISILMMIFGIGEIAIVIKLSLMPSYNFDITSLLAISLGAIYIISGLLIIPKIKWVLTIVIALLSINIVLRIFMLITGFYPTTNLTEIIGFIIGISLVIFFLVYILFRRKALIL